ncbi:MAG: hypothetical protein OXG96_14600 [Acidobacteria bacterium]|nr:hypothetical protein [Acidobacteriota bacterium]
MIGRGPWPPIVALALSWTLACFASVPASANNLRIVSGKAQVLTVNTLKVDNRIVDLKWIMGPPEYRPTKRYAHPGIRSIPMHATAVDALRKRIGSEAVTCEVEVRKLFGTFKIREAYEGICYLGDSTSGVDLNGWLVRQGLARVNRLGSARRYVQEERKAKAEEVGAWAFRKKFHWCCTRLDSPGKYERKSPSGLGESVVTESD